MFPDPRREAAGRRASVGLIGFYFPGRLEAWDKVCGSSFLGNFYDMSPERLVLSAKAPDGCQVTHTFRNAEAAFQALKFWAVADQFENVSGGEAFRLKQDLAGNEDWSYGGKGSNWIAMLEVLRAKFDTRTRFGQKLVETGDAFLLEHNSSRGRDGVWSDNCDGEGTNWLGIMLMFLRDELSGRCDWTTFLTRYLDFSGGQPLSAVAAEEWQSVVRSASASLVSHMNMLSSPAPAAGPAIAAPATHHNTVDGVFLCLKPGCGKPSWNGQPREFCSKACRKCTALCATGCGMPTFNGQIGEYCSRTCRDRALQNGAVQGTLLDDLGSMISSGLSGLFDGASPQKSSSSGPASRHQQQNRHAAGVPSGHGQHSRQHLPRR